MWQVALEEAAALLEAEQDVRRVMQSVHSSRRLDQQQQELQEQELADAEGRLQKLQLLVQGPPMPKVMETTTLCSWLGLAACDCPKI